MATWRVSRRTIAVLACGVLATMAVFAGIVLFTNAGNEAAATATSDIGEVLIVAASTAVVLSIALHYGKGEHVRRYWLLIGIGMVFFVLGDAIWTYFEVIQQVEPPYPGPPDIAYIIEYAFLGTGVILAGLAYRQLVSLKIPAILAVAVSGGIFALLYAVLLKDIIGDPEIALGEKALSLFYPTADVFLCIAPAILVLLVAWRLGKGRLGWPWVFVAVGLIILAISDSGYSYLEAQELYQSGNIVDAGWMLGNVLLAVGASLARDVYGA